MSVLCNLEVTIGNEIIELGSPISVVIMASLNDGGHLAVLNGQKQEGVITVISLMDFIVLIRLFEPTELYKETV